MANLITGCRVLLSAALLFFPAFSPPFYVLYGLAGLTDMIDGAVARRTGTAGEFGAKLDTVADFIFVATCAVKLLPALDIPPWLWIWTGAIAVIKAVNVICGYLIQKRFVAEHTTLNKLTGLLLFLFPLTVSAVDLRYCGGAVCAVAALAAVQEGRLIRTKPPKS